MIQQKGFVPSFNSLVLLTPCQEKALQLLFKASAAARSEGHDVWQFAVEIDQLGGLGLSHTDLRCLLSWGYLEHACEYTRPGDPKRLFHPLGSLVLPKRTCFVLTARGREITLDSCTETVQAASATTREPVEAHRSVTETPRWDGEACQLWWKTLLIKEFRRPAANQELVLAALEEEGWPPRIDDPLPPTSIIDPKVRLHDTIKALNRHHLHPILRFSGNGKGQRIQWAWRREAQPIVPSSSPDRPLAG
jgi:hypothetical protein